MPTAFPDPTAAPNSSRGNYDVVGIDGTDEKGGWLYFIASPDNATQRYLYRTRLDGSAEAERVSPANAPGTHTYDVSPDSRWAFHTYSRADLTPVTDLVEFPNHRSARVLEENSVLRANASALLETPVEFFKTDVSDGITLDAFIMKPPHFDPAKKYRFCVRVRRPAGKPFSMPGKRVISILLASPPQPDTWYSRPSALPPKGRAWRKRFGQLLCSCRAVGSARNFLASHSFADRVCCVYGVVAAQAH
jgi:dipeptidyl-peptidase-4